MKGCLYDFQGIRRSCGINVFIDVYRYHGKDHKLAWCKYRRYFGGTKGDGLCLSRVKRQDPSHGCGWIKISYHDLLLPLSCSPPWAWESSSRMFIRHYLSLRYLTMSQWQAFQRFGWELKHQGLVYLPIGEREAFLVTEPQLMCLIEYVPNTYEVKSDIISGPNLRHIPPINVFFGNTLPGSTWAAGAILSLQP